MISGADLTNAALASHKTNPIETEPVPHSAAARHTRRGFCQAPKVRSRTGIPRGGAFAPQI